MSTPTPDCPRCSLYKGEVALLRAEIAGLRNSVLALTRHSTDGAAVMDIISMDEAERLSLAGPFIDGPDIYFRAALTFRDQLSAQCLFPVTDSTEFLRFFEDLAHYATGWQGEKKVTSYADQFSITCTYDGGMYRPEVHMDVYCAICDPSFDPYWTVQLRLDVAPEALAEIAAQARIVFGNKASQPGA